MTARSALPAAPPPPSRYVARDVDERPLPTWLLDVVTPDDFELMAAALETHSVSGVSRCDQLARLLRTLVEIGHGPLLAACVNGSRLDEMHARIAARPEMKKGGSR